MNIEFHFDVMTGRWGGLYKVRIETVGENNIQVLPHPIVRKVWVNPIYFHKYLEVTMSPDEAIKFSISELVRLESAEKLEITRLLFEDYHKNYAISQSTY